MKGRKELKQESTLQRPSYNSADRNTLTGQVDGTTSGLKGEHEPDNEHQSGTGDEPVVDDEIVNDDIVIQRHNEARQVRLKPKSRKDYHARWRAFSPRIAGKTRRQLAGPAGKRALLDYFGEFRDTGRLASWRTVQAALKSVWIYGLRLPWPIDAKTDLPPLPQTKRGPTPRDGVVKEWAEKLANEVNEYDKCLFLFYGQLAYRPSHVCELRWRHVHRDNDGQPYAIVADGTECDFKTKAPVCSAVFPDLKAALVSLEKMTPYKAPNDPVFPWYNRYGRFERRATSEDMLEDRLVRIGKRWKLPHLTARDFRHYVNTACRRMGLSGAARSALSGYGRGKPQDTFGDWYDNPCDDDLILEQLAKLPSGPLGLVMPPKVEIDTVIPPELTDLMARFICGSIGSFELARQAETVWARMSQEVRRVGP